jgi:hypothetical protein
LVTEAPPWDTAPDAERDFIRDKADYFNLLYAFAVTSRRTRQSFEGR